MASDIGITGLAVMGQNLARNMARHGFEVALHNRSQRRTRELVDQYGHEGAFTPTASLEDLVGALKRPRRVLIMVKAGPPVDEVTEHLAALLEPGDIVIDGGNSHFDDTRRREAGLRAKGLHFIGTGISGGEEGALNGPSMMPGGSEESYEAVEPIFTAIAANVDGVPCCTHVGPDGAGHFVKMVHNGIEYADMQLIAEAYDLLTHVGGLAAAEIAAIFDSWNKGDLESFLVEITAKVLSHVDETTGRPLVDVILDEAEQKGTGRWTAQSALELGVPITTITEAVYARSLSAGKAARSAAARVLTGPAGVSPGGSDRFAEDVRAALYASKVVAYAQGFEHIRAASDHYGWGIDAGAMATIWRGGCIIRARFLDAVRAAYDRDSGLANLLLDDYFRDAVADAQDAWRRVIATAVDAGVPAPAFSSSLAYYDGYRRETGPANLIQGLRDFFGAHTYRRIDRPGTFHTRWGQDGKEVEA
jgi:6-phosphogluconate dehydrogenase